MYFIFDEYQADEIRGCWDFSHIYKFVCLQFQKGKLYLLFLLTLYSDGATRCGPFCVVYNALEQITVDREVDIFTIARQLQVRRPEFVSTLVSIL